MRLRMIIFIVIYFAGAEAISNRLSAGWNWAMGIVVWVMVMSFLSMKTSLFRCPHCAKLAIRTPGGGWSPLVGGGCSHCGRPY